MTRNIIKENASTIGSYVGTFPETYQVIFHQLHAKCSVHW